MSAAARGAQSGIRLYSSNSTWDSVDENVEFKHKSVAGVASWRITRIDTPSPQSPQAILGMFRSKIERCGGIKSQDSPGGVIVGSKN